MFRFFKPTKMTPKQIDGFFAVLGAAGEMTQLAWQTKAVERSLNLEYPVKQTIPQVTKQFK